MIFGAVLCNEGECGSAYDVEVEESGGEVTLSQLTVSGGGHLSPNTCTSVWVTATVAPNSLPGTVTVSLNATESSDHPCGNSSTGCGESATITVPGDYATAAIEFKTFIACQAISTGYNPLLFDYYAGDGRTFALGMNQPSRTKQSGTVTANPANPTGQVGNPVGVFGPSIGYDDDPTGSDIGVGPVWPCGPCIHFAVPTATANCSATATSLLAMQFDRISTNEVQVILTVDADNPCAMPDANINAYLWIDFRQVCADGILGLMEFKLHGDHDGYPWYELYLNGVRVYAHDPCLTGEGFGSLFPPAEIDFQNGSFGGVPLNQWQPVPGQGP